MLYLKCPTCHKLLGHIQIPYEEGIDEINNKFEMEEIDEQTAEKQKKELLNKLLLDKDRYCCRLRVLTYIRLIDIIK
jgi:DNA-directed RNA polymerase subunit N (RpoN/RPB10)